MQMVGAYMDSFGVSYRRYLLGVAFLVRLCPAASF